MFSWERAFVNFVRRHLLVIALVLVAAAAFFVRYAARSVHSADMDHYLVPWFTTLKEQGLGAVMALPNYDYPVAYMLLLWPFTLLPFYEMACVKLVSMLFDYALAVGVALCTVQLCPKGADKRLYAFGAFACVLFLPTVVLNSSYWGQCESIYSAFLVFMLYFLLKEKYTPAFTFFALAVCFKLQAVFFLPVLIILYAVKRRFSALQFLQAPALLTLVSLAGRTPGAPFFLGFSIYLRQAGQYPDLYKNYPNLFKALEYHAYDLYAPTGFVLCFVAFLMLLVYLVRTRRDITGDALVLLMVWVNLSCVHLLPSMHERYGYTGEVLVWLFFLAQPSAKRFIMALAVDFIPLTVYVRELFYVAYLEQEPMSLVNIVVYLLFTGAMVWYFHRRLPVGSAEPDGPPQGRKAFRAPWAKKARAATPHPPA